MYICTYIYNIYEYTSIQTIPNLYICIYVNMYMCMYIYIIHI